MPLNADSRAAFERLRQARIGDGPIPIIPEGPIFVGRNRERRLRPRHWFEDAIKKAGLVDFSWHDLRHTFVGHKKIQMTMRYAHLAPEHKLVAVERLKAYIR